MHPLDPGSPEQGIATVTVALCLPMLILFASFAIDVGSWFVHARHLQTQADAGALAAAGDFRFPCSNAAIESRAREYSGDESGGYNHQIGGTGLTNIHFALNSRTYPGGDSRTDPTVVTSPPCEAGMIDVKLTETDLPLFFRLAGLFTSVPFISAHARVQIFSEKSIAGALPVAVPDTNPQRARATFIDEQSGEVLGTRELKRDGSSSELAIWDNAAEPLPLTVNRERIGVRVALSGGSSTTCGTPLVECYDAGSTNGILFLRGYSATGSGTQPNPPLARNVNLTSGTCPDPYFSGATTTCGIGIHADVDFGPCSEISKVAPTLTALVGGNKYALAQTGCPTGTRTSSWQTTGSPVPIAPGTGPIPVTLEWAETKGKEGGNECKSTGGNKCVGSFGTVQRSFAAISTRSGPIQLAQIWQGASPDANSFERCSEVQTSCTHEVVVRLGIKQNLEENASSVKQAPVALRVFHESENNPSQNQSIDCDPNLPNLRSEIAEGCSPKYAINEGTSCPSPAELWRSPEPWECAAIQTGGAVNMIAQGMNKRILGKEEAKAGECTHPNEWSRFPNLNPNDPRIVPVFLTPFGSFAGSGNTTVPVTDFATFYVTGWAGQGGGGTSQSICPTDDPAEPGTIVGHFIKYVQSLNEGGASEEPCEFSAPTPCVAVLTE